jgi:hypothetical protein
VYRGGCDNELKCKGHVFITLQIFVLIALHLATGKLLKLIRTEKMQRR